MSLREERLVAILDGIGECFCAVDRDWRITVFNRWAEEFFGMDREVVAGRLIWDVFQIGTVPELELIYRNAMAGRGSGLTLIASPARPDRWLEGRAFPLPDGMGAAFRDVTDRVRDEQALRRREGELARVQRIAGVGGLEVELTRGFINRRSPEYLRIHGLPPDSATESHEDWVRRIHPEDRERAERSFKEAVRDGAVTYEAEYRIIRPSDGQLRWIRAVAEIERGPDGRALRLVGAHRDVTERKLSEERQRLLINELNHRVKNTLATVQSVAAQSIGRAASRAEIWPALESRLLALSRAHDVLTRASWDDVDFRDVVDTAIAPYRGAGDGLFTVGGPPLRLPPRLALAFAMILQELITNAVKYGSLSVPQGRVEIAWACEEKPGGLVTIRWAERGGPRVAAPDRRGFGSRLIENGLASEAEGRVDLSFRPEGVACDLQARLPRLPSDTLRWVDAKPDL